VLLPVVLLLGVATYVRQVQINDEEFKLVLAMNRLRHAYLAIEPGLEPYLTTGHHDDERVLVATYMLDHPSRRWLLVHFMINTPTIVATVDAALAAAIAVLVLQTAGAATAVMVAGGVVAFLAVWGGLMPQQRHTADPLRRGRPRSPPHAGTVGHGTFLAEPWERTQLRLEEDLTLPESYIRDYEQTAAAARMHPAVPRTRRQGAGVDRRRAGYLRSSAAGGAPPVTRGAAPPYEVGAAG
jgi:hypothetical protein